MRTSRVLLSLLLLVLVATVPLHAQLQRLRFERLSVEEGLPGLVTTMLQDSLGFLWIATNNGLARYDGLDFTVYRHDPLDSLSLSHRFVTALHEDRHGDIWVGTLAGGLDRLDPATGRIDRFQLEPTNLPTINRIFEDGAGVLWLVRGDGSLDWLDPGTGSSAHYRFDSDDSGALRAPAVVPPSSSRVPAVVPISAASSVLVDRSGTLWVGTRGGGLYYYDASQEVFAVFRHDAEAAPSLLSDTISVVYEAPSEPGVLWIGTDAGIDRFDRGMGTFVRYQNDPDRPESLPGTVVNAIIEDHAGTLWVESRGMNAEVAQRYLSRFDRTDGRFTSYPLPEGTNEPIYAVDRTGVLWIPTNQGLYHLDPSQASVDLVFTKKDGLPDNGVLGVLEDNEGRLWISTRNGLCRFDPTTRDFRNYNIHDGLPSNRFNSAAYRLSSGEMAFGTNNGFVVIDPRQDVPHPRPPAVHVTGLRIFNEPVVPGAGGPLPVPLDEAEEIRLRHHQNDVTIEYVGLHFSRPERIRYRYMLDGYESDWRDAARERRAVYPNLPPGDYVFRVTAANADGVWNEEGASIRVVVLPPWWRTWWAYVLYGLFLATGVVVVDRVQRRRLIRKERERAAREAEKLRTEAAEAWANYLQAENERKTQELEAARALQLSMLPQSVPEHPLVEIAVHMETATEVGGDYYDFHMGEDGTLTLAIGDATGHGAQAGTMVTAAKTLFTNYAEEANLAEVLRKASHALQQMKLPRLYMAFALGKLKGRTLELAGAGMPPALVYRARSGCVEQVPLKGIPLGGPGSFRHRSKRVDLHPGDTVVLMSDGFPELRSKAGEMIGYDGAVSLFAEVAPQSAEEIIAYFKRAAASWMEGQPQGDDITFLVMKMRHNDI